MQHPLFQLSLARRLLSFALATMLTSGMLVGVDRLATGEPDAGLLARVHLSHRA